MTASKRGRDVDKFVMLVTTLVGVAVSLFLSVGLHPSFREPDQILVAIGCIAGAGAGFFFGTLITGKPPKT